MSALDFALASVNATDCSPFLAALDEEAYCEAILPLLGDIEAAEWTMPTDEDAEWETPPREPIPGHFHYADAGYWG